MHHEMVSFANQLYFGVELHIPFVSAREKASQRRLRLVPGRAGNCAFDDRPSPEEFASQAQAGPANTRPCKERARRLPGN